MSRLPGPDLARLWELVHFIGRDSARDFTQVRKRDFLVALDGGELPDDIITKIRTRLRGPGITKIIGPPREPPPPPPPPPPELPVEMGEVEPLHERFIVDGRLAALVVRHADGRPA